MLCLKRVTSCHKHQPRDVMFERRCVGFKMGAPQYPIHVKVRWSPRRAISCWNTCVLNMKPWHGCSTMIKTSGRKLRSASKKITSERPTFCELFIHVHTCCGSSGSLSSSLITLQSWCSTSDDLVGHAHRLDSYVFPCPQESEELKNTNNEHGGPRRTAALGRSLQAEGQTVFHKPHLQKALKHIQTLFTHFQTYHKETTPVETAASNWGPSNAWILPR